MKFEDIRIYDKNFNLLLILPRYMSVNWEIKFCGYGTGEIQLPKTHEIVNLLLENKYLFVVQNDIQAIVTSYKIGEECTLFVRTLEWLLTKFAVSKFSAADAGICVDGKCTADMLIEYVLKEFLHEDFGVEFCTEGADEADMSEYALTEASTVYSVIMSAIKNPKTGFVFYRDFSDGHFVFFLKTAKENDNLIFCDRFKTAYDSEYNFDIQQEASGGIYYHKVTNMGKWDGSQNTPVITIDPQNYGKYYTVSEDGIFMGKQVYKGDVLLCKSHSGAFEVVEAAEPFLVEIAPEDDGIFSWTAPLVSGDGVSAEKELSQKKTIDMVTCMTGLSYVEDFNLGDMARVIFFADEMSYEKKKLISAIHIWDEPDDSGAVPTITDIS